MSAVSNPKIIRKRPGSFDGPKASWHKNLTSFKSPHTTRDAEDDPI